MRCRSVWGSAFCSLRGSIKLATSKAVTLLRPTWYFWTDCQWVNPIGTTTQDIKQRSLGIQKSFYSCSWTASVWTCWLPCSFTLCVLFTSTFLFLRALQSHFSVCLLLTRLVFRKVFQADFIFTITSVINGPYSWLLFRHCCVMRYYSSAWVMTLQILQMDS